MPQPTPHTSPAPLLARATVPAAGALPGGPSTPAAWYALRPPRNHPAPARTRATQQAQAPASAARVLPAPVCTRAGSHT